VLPNSPTTSQGPTLLGCGGRLRLARRRVRHPGGHCELRLAVRNSGRTPAAAAPVTPRTRAQPSSSRGAGVSRAGSGSTEEQGARPHVLQIYMYNGLARCRPWPARAGLCRHVADCVGPQAAPGVGHFVGPRGTRATLHRATTQPGTNIFTIFVFPKM
jgi:hypothetical protein